MSVRLPDTNYYIQNRPHSPTIQHGKLGSIFCNKL